MVFQPLSSEQEGFLDRKEEMPSQLVLFSVLLIYVRVVVIIKVTEKNNPNVPG